MDEQKQISLAARVFGRLGGKAKSARKTAACRRNAKLPRTRKGKNGATGTARKGKGGWARKLSRRAQ